jgi:hypothetical protein
MARQSTAPTVRASTAREVPIRLGVQIAKEIGFMEGITVATHRSTATTEVRSRRLSWAPATGALLAAALLVVLLWAIQSGRSAPATTDPTQELVQQQDRGMDHLTQTIDLPGQSTEAIHFPGYPV